MAPWDALRQMRSAPPGLAGMGDRRKVFSAALQQAEELHRSARRVGLASKPIVLFYALSQAGRAIAAARERSPQWRLRGHGLKVEPQDPIGKTRIVPPGTSPASFDGVAQATGARPPGAPVTLGQLWASLPELETAHGLGHCEPRPQPLDPYPFSFDGGVDDVLIAGADTPADEHGVRQRFAAYPQLVGRKLVGLAFPVPTNRGWGITWDPARVQQLAPEYPGKERVLLPSLEPNELPPSPLLVWWMITIGLASLARYEPERWSAAIDVDGSPLAVPLQRGLRSAERQIPRLVLAALRGVI